VCELNFLELVITVVMKNLTFQDSRGMELGIVSLLGFRVLDLGRFDAGIDRGKLLLRIR
jgi:hypothetical protein